MSAARSRSAGASGRAAALRGRPTPGPGPANPGRFAGLAYSGAAFAALVLAAGVVVAVVGTAVTREPAVTGIGSSPWIVGFGIPVLRTLLDLGAVAVAGLSLLSMMIGFDLVDRAGAPDRAGSADRIEVILGRARRLSVWASALWGSCALLSIVLLSVELEPDRTLGPASVWSYITNIAAGKGLLISAGSALLSMWLCRVSIKHGENVPAELRIGVALFGLLPLPLTGHAADWSYHDLSMLSMELHVVAATAWAGGLAVVVVFLARQPALLAVALPRFSGLATWCVFVVAVTGIFNGLLELTLSPITQLPGSLFTTRYGVLLLAKAACMGVVAVLAIHVRRRILPRVADGRSTTIAFWCGLEILVLAAAFGVAVVLTPLLRHAVLTDGPTASPRRDGLLLVLVVLLLAVAVPRSLPRSIAGSPVPAAVAGAPTVGDCVSPPPDGWNPKVGIRGERTYPPAITLPCTDRRNGEVIAVRSAGQLTRSSPPAGGALAESDRNADWCSAQLNGYLGLAAASSPEAQTAWQPLSTLTTAVAGPSALQRAFGQHWLSCIAYVAAIGGTGATGRSSYDRSLRAGYTSGRIPRSAALCLLTPDPQLPAVACSTPHQAELFGSGWSATPVTALTPTCRELVRHLTGMPDPTAGGTLTVETAQQRLQIVTSGVAAGGASNVGRPTGETLVPVCLVAVSAHHALAGPLLDLGTAPVPWA